MSPFLFVRAKRVLEHMGIIIGFSPLCFLSWTSLSAVPTVFSCVLVFMSGPCPRLYPGLV